MRELGAAVRAGGAGHASDSLHYGSLKKFRDMQRAGPPFSLLTREEVFALFDYVEWGYQILNTPLIEGTPLNRLETVHVNLINSGLSKLPPHRGRVYRAELDRWNREQIESRIADFDVGNIYETKGFLSSTLGTNDLAQSSYRSGARPIILEIESKSGRWIEPLSSRDWEQEVLFKPGTRFRVVSKTRVEVPKENEDDLGYQWQIKLREI